MREILFKYVIKTEIEMIEKVIFIELSLKELCGDQDEWSIVYDNIEDYISDNYCTCNFSETKNHCDCLPDWNEDFEIIERLQFTGLTGKSGVKIFEKAGVTFLTYEQSAGEFSNGSKSETIHGIVKYIDSAFVIVFDGDYQNLNITSGNVSRIEVKNENIK